MAEVKRTLSYWVSESGSVECWCFGFIHWHRMSLAELERIAAAERKVWPRV